MSQLQSNIKALTLAGFRAYLDEQSFDFRSGHSLIVYAPNAKGKSSLVDAIEFIFSKDGTVKRLGEKRSSIQGGRESLFHHDAETRGIKPSVQVVVKHSQGQVSFARSAKEPEQIPADLLPVTNNIKVPFIIRGFELRKFVEDEQPKDRYESVARWFGFEPLLKTQSSLRGIKLEIKKEIESKANVQNLDLECSKITNRNLTQWNEQKVVEWLLVNHIRKLEPDAKYSTLAEVEAHRSRFADLAAKETQATNLTHHRNLIAQINSLIAATPPKKEIPLDEATTALTELESAQTSYALAKTTSANAVFDQLWTEAEKILGDQKTAIDQCPVCETDFKNAPGGSRNEVHLQIKLKLEKLSAFKSAENTLKKAQDKAKSTVAVVSDRLTAIITLSETLSLNDEKRLLEKSKSDLAIPQNQATALSTLKNQIKKLAETVELTVKSQESKSTITWASVLIVLDSLTTLKKKVDLEVRRKQQLHAIQSQVTTQTTHINQQIKKYVDGLIGTLTNLTNFFYQEVQSVGGRVPAVHLVLPPEDRQVQNALELLIDFADNRKGVAPAGYLSDSQVHTLALSLRFAAIKLFNKEFPFLVLDDIVTSYDSDFRSTIASVLAKHFTGQQVLLVTHDEQFFNQLQDHLNRSNWIFKRIINLDPTFGPKYADHRVQDDLIDDEHTAGNETPNKVRQAEEDWLTDICRDFGVDVRMREVNHPYRFSRAELAIALHKFLGEVGRKPPAINAYQNPFLITLQRGTIENMGSHFSDNPNTASSLGDEKTRWGHFKEFRSHFACPNCGKNRFKRPEGLTVPVCKKCETQFAFK